jgi:hypothetical protein
LETTYSVLSALLKNLSWQEHRWRQVLFCKLNFGKRLLRKHSTAHAIHIWCGDRGNETSQVFAFQLNMTRVWENGPSGNQLNQKLALAVTRQGNHVSHELPSAIGKTSHVSGSESVQQNYLDNKKKNDFYYISLHWIHVRTCFWPPLPPAASVHVQKPRAGQQEDYACLSSPEKRCQLLWVTRYRVPITCSSALVF